MNFDKICTRCISTGRIRLTKEQLEEYKQYIEKKRGAKA
jgi:hypothetical protein